MKKLLIQEDIRKLIPHRYPILLVEEILDYLPNEKITGYAYLGSEDSVFRGHFPGFPILPGVYLVEALAQTSSILMELNRQQWIQTKELIPVDNPTLLGVLGNTNVRFRYPVFPGTELLLDAVIEKQFSNTLFLKVRAYNEEKVFLTGSISVTTVSRNKLSRETNYERVYKGF
jgi:3-hydroxyacyl-[acyl-carrier-protein] dehydratase